MAFNALDVLRVFGPEALPGRGGFTWLSFPGFELRIGFAVDQITLVMLAVVTGVSTMIFIYSVGYMHGDPRYGLFFTWLSLFVTSMMLLVLADNFLLLYAAWELVGLCSFLLIGFYYERRSAAEAAKKAFVTTRIGDVGLLIGIILLWREVGTFDISEIIEAAEAGEISSHYLTMSVLLLFAGAAGKSAQFPLHVWLPDAMEGPTPVSALIHAATMVVAGVYLVARTLPLFEAAPYTSEVVTALGTVTVLISVGMGLVMTDIKKVVAYSTINSLGLMMVALGSGSVTAAMLYLLTHAFLKALLFLAAGSVIHATEQQEVEKLGGLWRKMPLTATAFGIGALAMAGIPPLSGFWAKDEIMVAVSEEQHIAILALMLLSVVGSAVYMARIFILTFLGEPRDHHVYEHAHESPPIMTLPLVVLAVGAIISGFVVFDGVGEFLTLGGGFGEFVYAHEPHPFQFHADIGFISIALAVFGVILGFYYWWAEGGRRAVEAGRWAPEIYALFINKFYIDDLYQAVIDRGILLVAGIIAWFDRAVVNDTGVDGVGAIGVYSGFRLKFIETGRLPNYALVIVIGVVVLALTAIAVRG